MNKQTAFFAAHKNRHKWRLLVVAALAIVALGFVVPDGRVIPVRNAIPADWNPESFWHGGWGASGVHKGVDIFAAHGTPVISSTAGVVLFRGTIEAGGNIVVVLGPKWRLHYYAHLAKSHVRFGQVLRRGRLIGAVGNTGNAAKSPPHLHYSASTLFPYPWRITGEQQGWKKMFYLDPIARLSNR